jgi:hypothetical protein
MRVNANQNGTIRPANPGTPPDSFAILPIAGARRYIIVIVDGVSRGLPQDLASAVRGYTHDSGAFRRRERAGLYDRREVIEFCQGSRSRPRVRCRATVLSSSGVGDTPMNSAATSPALSLPPERSSRSTFTFLRERLRFSSAQLATCREAAYRFGCEDRN